MEVITSLSQRLHLEPWLQDDVGINRHDAMDSNHSGGSFMVTARRIVVDDAFHYQNLLTTDRCGFRLCWDPSVVSFDALFHKDSSMISPWLWEHSHLVWNPGIILCSAFN